MQLEQLVNVSSDSALAELDLGLQFVKLAKLDTANAVQHLKAARDAYSEATRHLAATSGAISELQLLIINMKLSELKSESKIT